MGKNSMIAVFDSGVGGLSVYKAIKKLLPAERIVYLADGAHFPYGDKKPALVRRLTLQCLKFLTNPSTYYVPRTTYSSPKLIVVACNTATVSGIDFYKKALPGIPIIGVVPVVKTAAEKTKNGRIAIISTVATARSKYQNDLIEKFCGCKFDKTVTFPSCRNVARYVPTRENARVQMVLNVGCPNLVHHIEKGITEGGKIEKELRQILAPVIAAKCDVLALGCTHYPFLKKTIDAILGPSVLFLDSADAVARHAKRILEKNNLLCTPSPPSIPSLPSPDLFLTTGNSQTFAAALEQLLKIKTTVKQVKI